MELVLLVATLVLIVLFFVGIFAVFTRASRRVESPPRRSRDSAA